MHPLRKERGKEFQVIEQTAKVSKKGISNINVEEEKFIKEKIIIKSHRQQRLPHVE